MMSCQSRRNEQIGITPGNTNRRKDSLWVLNCSNLVNSRSKHMDTERISVLIDHSLTLQASALLD